jgi:hypothetical protein
MMNPKVAVKLKEAPGMETGRYGKLSCVVRYDAYPAGEPAVTTR